MEGKIYFAHPVNIYNTAIENAFIALITHELCNGDPMAIEMAIENPNQPHHQVGYTNFAQRLKESGLNHKGMNYFFEEVLPYCAGCVAVPFLDSRFGLGVAGELRWFVERNQPVWFVSPQCLLSADDLESFIKNPTTDYFLIRSISPEEKQLIISSDQKLVVPHEETRLRTWRVYSQEMRPYQEAHMVKMPIPEGFYPKG